ncbi:MAG: PilT/PilU family type 4a pilus ATPase [Proteobacteria bacterium]|nr:PilT/PilU family type 4a pilus ATPase [Pseudomonadota bacterium]
MDLNQMLYSMAEHRASDLHIRVGAPPLLRIEGVLKPLEQPKVTIEYAEEMFHAILTDVHKEKFQKEFSLDTSYSIKDFRRFRVNVFLQRGTISFAFRSIPTSIPTIESLGLPQVLKTLCDKPYGLVLVAGPTGCGKSTTLAAMIEYINQTQAKHIITIEDPIEFAFSDSKSFITQREVGLDTPSYDIALKDALRQDPDVIFLGEMRNVETISTVLSATETGHLIFSTIHAKKAFDTVSRIVDAFPAELRSQTRIQLSNALLGAVSQRLVPRKDGKGRVAAVEALIASPRIKELIEKNQLKDIREEMEKSVTLYRMQSLEQSLIALIANKIVSHEDALKVTLMPEETKLTMDQMGISETGDVRQFD